MKTGEYGTGPRLRLPLGRRPDPLFRPRGREGAEDPALGRRRADHWPRGDRPVHHLSVADFLRRRDPSQRRVPEALSLTDIARSAGSTIAGIAGTKPSDSRRRDTGPPGDM